MKINLSDNNLGENTFRREEIAPLFPFAGKTVAQLCQENENLLIFPYDIETTDDRIGKSTVLTISNTESPDLVHLTTGNIIGFIGIGPLKIKIKSRFDNGRDDYFLHYMLQKVLSFNLFDLNHNNEEEDVFDFVMFMFPYFLKSALRQGLYREYRREEHNDARVRGAIEVNRFIRKDIPFQGRIAYSVRNYSYDNAMTELIRHTIEYMKTKRYGQNVLSIDAETAEYVHTVIDNTPSYDPSERQNIVLQNLRLRSHPYYTEYRPLQILCLQILGMEGIKYGEDENEVCGILFDAAWLWEEYVNTLLRPLKFIHSENKLGKGKIYLFEDLDENGKIHRSGSRYPDFYKENIVLDAKYKMLGTYQRVSQVQREDLHQVITYMTRLQYERGGFIAPLRKEQETIPTAHIKDSKYSLSIYGIKVCDNAVSFHDFSREMERYEKQFIASLNLNMDHEKESHSLY